MPDLRGILGAAGFWAAAPARAYTAAGSFLRFLRDTQGTERLQRLLAHGDFAGVYGRPLDTLVAEWERMLDGLPLDESAVNRAFARFRQPSLFRRPCAREVAALADEARGLTSTNPSRALQLLRSCARLQPDEPDFLLAEVALLRKLNRPSEAAEVARACRRAGLGRPALEAQVALARADCAWDAGELQTAGAPSSRRPRSARARPGARGGGEARGARRRAAPSDVARLLRREQRRAAAVGARASAGDRPERPLVNYLLGRRLLAVGLPAAASVLERTRSGSGFPLRSTARPGACCVSAHYRAGDCGAVRSDLGRMPDSVRPLRPR